VEPPVPPIDRLVQCAKDNLSEEWLKDFLKGEEYLPPGLEEPGSDVGPVLQQYLFEREPFYVSYRLFPVDTLVRLTRKQRGNRAGLSKIEMLRLLFDQLNIPPFPSIDWRYELPVFLDYLRSRDTEDKLDSRKTLIVKGVLQDTWAKLEALLRIMLVFYQKLFDQHLDTDLVGAFVRTASANNLGYRLNGIEQIEELFNKDKLLQQISWRLCYRKTPFSGLNIKSIRQAKDNYRNRLAHWDSDRVAEVSRQVEKFVKGSFDAVKSTVKEIRYNNLAPTTLIIVNRGNDVYGRGIYGFVDERFLLSNQQEDYVGLPLRWFYCESSTHYPFFHPFFFVDPPTEGIFEPKLISRDEVISKYLELSE
jgi:hypothetical protein